MPLHDGVFSHYSLRDVSGIGRQISRPLGMAQPKLLHCCCSYCCCAGNLQGSEQAGVVCSTRGFGLCNMGRPEIYQSFAA